MSSAQPSRSSHTARYLGLSVVALAMAVTPLFGSLVTTNIFVVSEEDPITEDVYVTSQRVIVDGLIDGDLTAFSGNVTINGTVTGDLIAFSSATVTVNEGARVGGALRGAAVNFTLRGEVGTDVFVSAASVVVEETGEVGRDVMAFGGVLRVEGTVGRDVRGRTIRTVVDGSVAGDIDVATQKFEVGAGAVVGGDILYRSPVNASVDPGATISGTVTRLPTQSNFVYGVILSLANIVGFLGFVVAGLVALLVLRGSGARATGAMLTKPIRSFLYGLAAVLAVPAAIVVLAATLVGIPLAILLVVSVVAAFIIGPVPAVTALGNRILVRRGGLFGAFIVGAIIWRFGISVIPVVGGFLYLVGLIWGVGAWIVGFIDTRRQEPVPVGLLPAAALATGGVPDDWEPPLAPMAASPPPDEPDSDGEAAVTEEVEAGVVEADLVDEDAVQEHVVQEDVVEEGGVDSDAVEPVDVATEGSAAADPTDDEQAAKERRAAFEALLAESEIDDSSDAELPPGPPSNDDWGLPSA
jgi:cytoskeletal protein CcmA (bactofilin family)